MNRHFMEEERWMANNDLKRCSTSLVIREMQIKTIENYHFIQTSLAKGKKPGKFWACRGAAEALAHCCWLWAQAKPLWDTARPRLPEGSRKALCNPAALPRRSPEQRHLESHVRTFRAASFVITRKLEADQMWPDGRREESAVIHSHNGKRWYIHIMENDTSEKKQKKLERNTHLAKYGKDNAALRNSVIAFVWSSKRSKVTQYAIWGYRYTSEMTPEMVRKL